MRPEDGVRSRCDGCAVCLQIGCTGHERYDGSRTTDTE
jgi:hypothetical protein